VHVVHKPGLKWPWQVRIINRAGKSVMLWATKTEDAARQKAEQVKNSVAR
jgi:hypothetical protein